MMMIPKPVRMEQREGRFVIGPGTVIRVEADGPAAAGVGEYLAEFLATPLGFRLTVEDASGTPAPGGAILLRAYGPGAALGDEGYELCATPRSVTISATTSAGLFHGAQSFLQLLPPEVFATVPVAGKVWALPCVDIQDQPRFPWRGMMLDVSRHFFPVEFVKRCIDVLALHKMNVFHWHLTDDGGWRMEVKSRPRLTEIGAWRAGDHRGWVWPIRFPGSEAGAPVYGGYYTQAEIREIVAYARRRHVQVVPEIELPGHGLGCLYAYPELRCQGARKEDQNVFCAGSEATFRFLEDVLAETMELFPDGPIHIGGDEVYKGYWEPCELCRARMQSEGLKDLNELQSYFIRRVEKIVNAGGRQIIGWDEILEGGLAPHASVMSWRGVDGGIAAANAGHDVVMSPTSHCYFDYSQSEDPAEPRAMGGPLPLEKVYAYEPIPEALPPEKRKHVLGTQGNVWTEFIETAGHAEYMTLPRLSALAEVAWSPAGPRDFSDFLVRLEPHFLRLDGMKVAYRRAAASKGGQ